MQIAVFISVVSTNLLCVMWLLPRKKTLCAISNQNLNLESN